MFFFWIRNGWLFRYAVSTYTHAKAIRTCCDPYADPGMITPTMPQCEWGLLGPPDHNKTIPMPHRWLSSGRLRLSTPPLMGGVRQL
jgi:hypothetical protein